MFACLVGTNVDPPGRDAQKIQAYGLKVAVVE
jgi:hypothetical protein